MDSTNSTNHVTLKPGDFLIRENTTCEAIYIIKEGQLQVYKTASDGGRVVIGLIGSGQYVGETALLTGNPYSSNVVALSEVKAIKLPKAAVEAQLKQAPAWLVALTKGLIMRLHTANEILKRNGWEDETLAERVKAVEAKFKPAS